MACAWCGVALGQQEVFGFGAKAAPGMALAPHRGRRIEIELTGGGRTVSTFVVGADSAAAREGHDFYFMTCSQTCGAALKAALDAEIAEPDA